MEKLIISSSPHLNGKKRTQNIMLDVIIALAPAMIAGVIFFGLRAAILIVTCVTACVLSEFLSRKIMKREQTVQDLSAVVTGILLALNLPVSINPLMAAFGSVVAVVVVKQMFGGIGMNFVNPALTARIVLVNSFPADMTKWTQPFSYGADMVTTATPLQMFSSNVDALSSASGGELVELPSYLTLFLGNIGGCIGETSALALLLGFVYLLARQIIHPVIPLVYVGTAVGLSFLFGRDPLFDLLTGGLLIGAIFMATDYTTCPMYIGGKVIFAFGCGALTMLIRQFGSMNEGVSYAIVIMNILVPLIERYVKPKTFGQKKIVKEKQNKAKEGA